MSKSLMFLALPLALAAVGSSPAVHAAAPKPVTCELRVVNAGGTMQMAAVAKATAAMPAAYQLAFTAVSAMGNDVTSEGDELMLAQGETVLATTSFDRGARYNAKLTVAYAGGSTSCAAKG